MLDYAFMGLSYTWATVKWKVMRRIPSELSFPPIPRPFLLDQYDNTSGHASVMEPARTQLQIAIASQLGLC